MYFKLGSNVLNFTISSDFPPAAAVLPFVYFALKQKTGCPVLAIRTNWES